MTNKVKIQEFGKNKQIMVRTVLLPRTLETKLSNLATLQEEVNGVLLYRPSTGTRTDNIAQTPDGDLCPVEEIYMTAVGSAGHVIADPDELRVLNEFFQKNQDYRFIKFHTHSKGTLEQFGEQFATSFSSGDIEAYDEQIERDNRFIGMLVTPSDMLLYGREDSQGRSPILKIVEGFDGYEVRNRAVNEGLTLIKQNLGHIGRPMTARRRR